MGGWGQQGEEDPKCLNRKKKKKDNTSMIQECHQTPKEQKLGWKGGKGDRKCDQNSEEIIISNLKLFPLLHY